MDVGNSYNVQKSGIVCSGKKRWTTPDACATPISTQEFTTVTGLTHRVMIYLVTIDVVTRSVMFPHLKTEKRLMLSPP